MTTRIQVWGNSQGIRIPKIVLDESGLSVNDEVDMSISDNTIILKKTSKAKHISLKDRLEKFYGKPITAVADIEQDNELDWGEPKGDEIW